MKYIKNLLKYVNSTTLPIGLVVGTTVKKLKYIRGEYVFSEKYKYEIIKQVGGDAYVLYDFFYNKRMDKGFKPTDDLGISNVFGWSKSKVTKLKKKLTDNDYLLINKSTTSNGTTLYQVILDKELVQSIKDTGELPSDIDVDIRTVIKKKITKKKG